MTEVQSTVKKCKLKQQCEVIFSQKPKSTHYGINNNNNQNHRAVIQDHKFKNKLLFIALVNFCNYFSIVVDAYKIVWNERIVLNNVNLINIH